MVHEGHGDECNEPGNGDGVEVVLELQVHLDQGANHDRGDDRSGTSHARGPADAGAAARCGIELAYVSVGQQLCTDRGGAGDANEKESQLGGRLEAQHPDRCRGDQEESHQYVLDMQSVREPPATEIGRAHV